jgi:hypothetical protein
LVLPSLHACRNRKQILGWRDIIRDFNAIDTPT